MAGTGVRAAAYVFLPVAKRLWHSREMNAGWASPEELAALPAARKGGAVTRLYNPPKDAQDAPILVHAARGRRAPDGLGPLLELFSRRWPVEAEPRPRLAICTHGTRDRCCAKWGFAAYNTARALFEAGDSPFEPLECSHLGGDRFAATGIFFPSGSMYAHLDSVDLAGLAAQEAAGRLDPTIYRGRVFEPPLTQVVRAGLAREGFYNDATTPLSVERPDPDAPRALATTRDGRRFEVELGVEPVRFYASCAKLEAGQSAAGSRMVYASGRELSPLLDA